LVAFAIAGYILRGAWTIARQSFDMLMDREFPDEERRRIRDIVMAHEEVYEMHDLRTRSSGVNSFIQLHLELDDELTLLRAHEIADEVELKIRMAYPGSDVIIHQDPQGVQEAHRSYI